MSAPAEDGDSLAALEVPSAASMNLTSLDFNYLTLDDNDINKVRKRFCKRSFSTFHLVPLGLSLVNELLIAPPTLTAT